MKKRYNPAKERTAIIPDEELTVPEEEITTSPEKTEKEKEKEIIAEGAQIIEVSEVEVPALKNLRPGDTMDLTVSVKVQRKDPKTKKYSLEITDIYSKEEQTETIPPVKPSDLAGILGGMGGGGSKA